MKSLLRHYSERLVVTPHAADAFNEATQLFYSPLYLVDYVKESKCVSVEELRSHGFMPNYTGRSSRGIKSWYAVHASTGWNAVFVISEDQNHPGTLIVVTTLHQRDPIIKELELKAERERKVKIDSGLIAPDSLWKSGDIIFRCVVGSRHRLALTAKILGKEATACTSTGRTFYGNPDEMAKHMGERELRFYKLDGEIHELFHPFEHVETPKRGLTIGVPQC